MIFTVNVMDWQQSVLDNSYSVSNDVWKHTLLMLEILHMHDVQASFFIPLSVASKYPVLVRKIHTAGHEIACLLESSYEKSSIQGKVQNGVHLLEDITENKIIGVRHLRLPIQHTDFDYYCSVLRKLGIQYDSSLVTNKSINALESDYPSLAAFKAYGISQYPLPRLPSLPFFNKLSLSWGGSSFRLLPYEMSHILAKGLNKETTVFHMPTYDLGMNNLSSAKTTYELSWHRKLDFYGRKTIPFKLKKLFGDYPFTSFENYYFDGYE